MMFPDLPSDTKILFLSASTELEVETVLQLQKQIVGEDRPFFAPLEFFSSLPGFELVFEEATFAASIISAHISLSHISVEYPNHQLIGICFSTAGTCKQIRYSTPNNISERRIDVLLLDLRVVYECLSICLSSPIAQSEADWRDTSTIIKLALATRLNSKADPLLDLISLGIASSAMDHLYTKDGYYPALDIYHLFEKTHLADEQIDEIIKTICRFILSHEIAHMIFRDNPKEREEWKHSLMENVRHLIGAFADHYEEEEKAYNKDDEFSTRNIKPVNSQLILDELNKLTSSSISIFSESDLEEVLCDFFAIGHSLLSIYGGAKKPSASLPAIYRETVNVVLETTELLGARSFNLIGEYIKQHVIGSTSGKANSNLVIRYNAAIERYDLILAARSVLFSYLIDSQLHHVRTHFDSLSTGSDDRILIFPTAIESNRSWRHRVLVKADIHQKVFNPISLMKLSSRGRGISLFMDPIDKSGNHSITRYDADPFSLYIFRLAKSWHNMTETQT